MPDAQFDIPHPPKPSQREMREITLLGYQGIDRVILAEEERADIEARRANRPRFQAFTKIPTLDLLTEGFRKGQLIVLSGPKKSGKTALAATFTKAFTEAGQKCLWFSYEMSYEEFFDKYPSSPLDFYVPKRLSSKNMLWVEDRIIESKAKYGTEVVVIDHFDFLRDPDVLMRGVNFNYTVYLGGIVQKLKNIAIEQELVLFLLCHISKSGRWISSELPTSEELADTRHLADLADIVLMIMRKRAPRNAAEDIYVGNEAVLGVVENRHNGKTRKFPVLLSNNEFIELVEAKEPVRGEREWE